ncbi:hypothetical protein FBU59_005260 [Linderina macrospora]|uniref:Uncharacterized protein n=1 Tax=Linderina macrospora TaxID=4868 RepID=A0ACC1J340_9FUNG|nr:hypothetical protein FBU59_005260 [Linderina macrospora]
MSMAEHRHLCTVIVRFSSGSSDLQLSLPEDTTISALKEQIYQQRADELAGKYLRLICTGRVLQDQLTLRHYNITANDDNSEDAVPHFVHCLATDIAPERSQQQRSDESVVDSAIEPARGFDRLRDAGFSDEDIENLRVQFHRANGTSLDDSENARAIEDSWMDSTAQDAPQETPAFGSKYHMLGGLLMGYFGGVLVLPWLKNSNLFSRQHQMGMMCGLIFNFSFGIVRWLYS